MNLDQTQLVNPGDYEGQEKRVRVAFSGHRGGPGLRSIRREDWNTILSAAACSILSVAHSDECDAYVLSESSLFVYRDEAVIKTCGTTVPLTAVAPVVNHAKNLDLSPRVFEYSRSEYRFPHEQVGPHTSWEHEVEALLQTWPGGKHSVLGSQGGPSWYTFSWAALQQEGSLSLSPPAQSLSHEGDYEGEGSTRLSQTPDSSFLGPEVHDKQPANPGYKLEIVMTGLPKHVMSNFWFTDDGADGAAVAKACGLADVIGHDAVFDGWRFDPCGYSLNAVNDHGEYFTVHITPQAHCDFVRLVSLSFPSPLFALKCLPSTNQEVTASRRTACCPLSPPAQTLAWKWEATAFRMPPARTSQPSCRCLSLQASLSPSSPTRGTKPTRTCWK